MLIYLQPDKVFRVQMHKLIRPTEAVYITVSAINTGVRIYTGLGTDVIMPLY